MRLRPEDIDLERERFGSSRLANARDMAKAGLFEEGENAFYSGLYRGRPILTKTPGGTLVVAAARGGKMRDILAQNVCGGMNAGSLVMLDPKGEGAAISKGAYLSDKLKYYWNAAKQHGMPSHRVNPADYMRKDSPTLVSDVKVFCENMIPLSGSANSQYFERRAREYLEAICLTLAEIDGVLTLPRLYWAINLIPVGGDAWLEFGFHMYESPFEIARRVEAEIAGASEREGNGFQGICGELFKAFAALSDPVLMDSVSPPFDFSLEDMTKSDQRINLYLMPPAEFIGPWSSVIKAIFVAGMIYKSRAPSAPRQTWILDECAELGGFPLVMRLFSYGAGIGIRPVAVFQSTYQMKKTGQEAENIITASAAVRIYFAIREINSARAVSAMLGATTLRYDQSQEHERAHFGMRQAMETMLRGENFGAASLAFLHHRHAQGIRSKQMRMLRQPEEIIATPPNRMFVFADELRHPIYAERRPYFQQGWMAGRYHPNPFHPPLDRVQIATERGNEWRRIIEEDVPAEFAHYPQYADGRWSYVEGFRP